MKASTEEFYPLKEIFSDLSYLSSEKKNLSVLLHLLLINFLEPFSEDNKTADEILQEISKASVSQLYFQEELYQLTPLHIAVILRREAWVEALLQKEPRLLTSPDIRGWTPWHHAAIRGEDRIWEILSTYAKAIEVTSELLINDNGGTPQDLLNLCFQKEWLEEEVFYYKKGELVAKGTGRDFKELLNAEFIREISFTPQQLIEEWLNKDEIYEDPDERACSSYVAPFYEQRCHRLLDPIYIDKAYFKKEGIILDIGYNAYALEDIPASYALVEYIGERISDKDMQRKSVYRWGKVDGHNKRNLAAILGDGFPNVVAFYTYHMKGVAIRTVFMTLEDIKKEESLCFNYGKKHSVKLGYREEFRLKEMEAFFLSNPFKSLIARIERSRKMPKASLGWEKTLQLESDITKLQYIFHTPSAMCHLLLNHIVSSEEVYTFFKSSYNLHYLLSFTQRPNFFEYTVLQCHEEIQKFFSIIVILKNELPPSIYQNVEKAVFPWLLSAMKLLTVKTFCLVLLERTSQEIGKFFADPLCDESNFVNYLNDQKESLIRHALNVDKEENLDPNGHRPPSGNRAA